MRPCNATQWLHTMRAGSLQAGAHDAGADGVLRRGAHPITKTFGTTKPPWAGGSVRGSALRQGPEALEAAGAELWFAGRPLAPDQPLSARLGCNDKTRVVVRLQRSGSGAPVREPARPTPGCAAVHAVQCPARKPQLKRRTAACLGILSACTFSSPAYCSTPAGHVAQVVDDETHKAMLAWHFKKQEQQKARHPGLQDDAAPRCILLAVQQHSLLRNA